MQNLLFELSDNGNPITDSNGTVIESIDDVVSRVCELSPALADAIELVYKQQQKQIEQLDKQLDESQRFLKLMHEDYDALVIDSRAEMQELKDTCRYIAEMDIAALYQQEGYIDVEHLQERLQGIYSCLMSLTNS